jgi:hypothetical protein
MTRGAATQSSSLATEQVVAVNTAAGGGNAELLMGME